MALNISWGRWPAMLLLALLGAGPARATVITFESLAASCDYAFTT